MTIADGCGRREMLQALSSCIAATVPRRSGSRLAHQTPENKPVDFKLYSPTPQPGEQFGWSLDLDVDEEGTCRAVIGAPGRSHEIYTNSDGTRLANAGAAYVYVLEQRRMLDPRATAYSAHG